jgi:hypothetical protein
MLTTCPPVQSICFTEPAIDEHPYRNTDRRKPTAPSMKPKKDIRDNSKASDHEKVTQKIVLTPWWNCKNPLRAPFPWDGSYQDWVKDLKKRGHL